jgi:hypothetical protein
MTKTIFTTFLLLITMVTANAQEIKSEVYEGKIDGKTPLTLYLQSYENGCTTDPMYNGMYKYNGKSEWLQVNITTNNNTQFVLVEYGFTGVLILKKEGDEFEGTWISPDTKRQLKVTFKKVDISKEKMKVLEDTFEEVNYVNYDC